MNMGHFEMESCYCRSFLCFFQFLSHQRFGWQPIFLLTISCQDNSYPGCEQKPLVWLTYKHCTFLILLCSPGNKVPLHPRAVQAMGSMLSKNQLNPADVTVLYKMYQIVSTAHENVPPVSLLRDPQFLNLMMSALFCKTCKINPDHKPKYIYLLAYAVSVFECWKAGRNDKYNRTSLNSTDLTPTVKASSETIALLGF